MMPVCRYFLNSECTNPRCKFLHPTEYPQYIYTTPGTEVHPDELRWAVLCDPMMATEADNIWLKNYKQFCSEPNEKSLDILEYPEYFCLPFDIQRVGVEIANFKNEFLASGNIPSGRRYPLNEPNRKPNYYQGTNTQTFNDNRRPGGFRNEQRKDGFNSRNTGYPNEYGNDFKGGINDGWPNRPFNPGPNNRAPAYRGPPNFAQDQAAGYPNQINPRFKGYQQNEFQTNQPYGFDRSYDQSSDYESCSGYSNPPSPYMNSNNFSNPNLYTGQNYNPPSNYNDPQFQGYNRGFVNQSRGQFPKWNGQNRTEQSLPGNFNPRNTGFQNRNNAFDNRNINYPDKDNFRRSNQYLGNSGPGNRNQNFRIQGELSDRNESFPGGNRRYGNDSMGPGLYQSDNYSNSSINSTESYRSASHPGFQNSQRPANGVLNKQDDSLNGFDRRPNPNQPQESSDEPKEFEYQNIPYNYK